MGLERVRYLAQQIGCRLTLQMRLALSSAALLFVVSLALVAFINTVATLVIPDYVVAPLLAPLPLPRPWRAGEPTPVPFLSPIDPHATPPMVLKGITVREVRVATLQQVRVISVVGLALTVVVGSAGAYWLAGRTLHPVRDLIRTTHRISANTLNTHIALEGPDDEIKELADAFDAMLGRLEHAFEQQGRFVADAAHELRTPLATLRTNLEVVRADSNATLDDYWEMSATLERALTRLEQLVADLLLLAQEEREVVKEEVALGPLLEDVLLDLKPVAEEHQVTLHLNGETEMSVHGDVRLLACAFSNLIENGIRYNHLGGEVVVTIRRDDAGAVVTVTDTGIGIPPEEHAHIFDRFYRVDRSRSRHKGDAGLGLSIVAHVVHLHGGTVQVESTPGAGSTFTVRLPL